MAEWTMPAEIALDDKVRRIQGPVLVLGSSGFVGATAAMRVAQAGLAG